LSSGPNTSASTMMLEELAPLVAAAADDVAALVLRV
jgi:hypothetical protein